jgi:hypothetical protein
VNTGEYVTVARPGIAAGWLERQPNPSLTLQTVLGEALPILKEAFLTLILGRRPLKIWVFVTHITNEFILGLDVLRAYDASVDIGRQTLRLAEEEILLWIPGARPRPSNLVVAKDQVIPAQCERIIMAKLESPLGVENGLVESSPQVHRPEGIYVARTLVRDSREVPVRVMNVNRCDQKFTKGSPLAHCEPVTLVTLPDTEQPQARDASSKLQDVTEAVRPHLDDGEFRELEELVAEYEDIFAVDSQDHGRTIKVYHRIDTGEARPIRQPPRRLPLAKQAEVSEMLDDIQRLRIIEESDSP